MADLLWPPECHPGTRSVPLPLWLGTHSFFDEKKTQFFCSFQFWSTRREFYISVCILSLPSSSLALLSIWDDRKALNKHRFVWNLSKMKLLFAIWVPICHDDPSEGGRDVSVPQSWTRPPANVQSWESEDVIAVDQSSQIISEGDLWGEKNGQGYNLWIGVEPATLSAP